MKKENQIKEKQVKERMSQLQEKILLLEGKIKRTKNYNKICGYELEIDNLKTTLKIYNKILKDLQK